MIMRNERNEIKLTANTLGTLGIIVNFEVFFLKTPLKCFIYFFSKYCQTFIFYLKKTLFKKKTLSS